MGDVHCSFRMAAVSNVSELDLDVDRDVDVGTLDRTKPRAAALPNLLSRENVKFVARSLRRFGVPDSDVDDAVQEVFFVASRKLDAISEGAERAFLYGTAMRIASNMRRVERRAQTRRADATSESTDALQLEVDEAPSPEDLLDRRYARAALDTILETMSAESRAAFVLFELEEMSIAEIASMLEIPIGTVGSRLRRAREHFDAQVRAMKADAERRLGRTP